MKDIKAYIKRKSAVDANGCWIWQGRCNPKAKGGHGKSDVYGENIAHRVSYIAHKGPIPEGLQIDHLCRTPACVNPEHLEVVTAHENWLRGKCPTRLYSLQTHCKRGHPLSGDNLYSYSGKAGVSRICRTCRAEYARSRYVSRRTA